MLLQKATKKETKIIHSLVQAPQKGSAEMEQILSFMNQYKIKEVILDLLKADANYLLTFLERFPETAIKQMMVERIESIIAV